MAENDKYSWARLTVEEKEARLADARIAARIAARTAEGERRDAETLAIVQAQRPGKNNMFNCDQQFWRTEFERRDVALQGHWYESYRRSAEYLARRQPVVDRANEVCEGCGQHCDGSWKRLFVHHLHYQTIWHETPDDLVALCKTCHERAHRGPDRVDPYLRP